MLDICPAGNNWRFKRNKMDIKPTAALKKCLFGEPEHESLKSDLNQMMNDIQTNDRLRWDFDFKKGKPVPGGRLEWEKMPLPAATHVIEDNNTKFTLGLIRSDEVSDAASSTETSPCTSPSTSSPVKCNRPSCLSVESPSTQRKLSGLYTAASAANSQRYIISSFQILTQNT